VNPASPLDLAKIGLVSLALGWPAVSRAEA
jgi:hypothetical protein